MNEPMPYTDDDERNDEAKIESLRNILPPGEFDETFHLRFEGYDEDGAYFSTMHNGALYYLDFLAKVPLINVRRRGAKLYWQVRTFSEAMKRVEEDYQEWQRTMATAEQGEEFAPPPEDVDDIPF